MEHLKFMSTQHSPRADGKPCTCTVYTPCHCGMGRGAFAKWTRMRKKPLSLLKCIPLLRSAREATRLSQAFRQSGTEGRKSKWCENSTSSAVIHRNTIFEFRPKTNIRQLCICAWIFGNSTECSVNLPNIRQFNELIRKHQQLSWINCHSKNI